MADDDMDDADDRRRRRRRRRARMRAFDLIGVGANATASYDADVVAWAAAVVAAGGAAPSAARKSLLSTLVVTLKASGDWVKLDALQILAAADAATGKVDLRAPARVATWGSGTGFLADRYAEGDGTANGRIDTAFNPFGGGVNYVRNDNTIGAWVIRENQTIAVTYEPDIACDDGTNYDYLNSTDGAGNARFPANASGDGGAANGGNVTGLFQRSRTASNLTTGYRNGVSLGTLATASAALLNFQHTLFAYAAGGSPRTDTRIAVYYAGKGNLSASAMYAALNTYLAAIGAV